MRFLKWFTQFQSEDRCNAEPIPDTPVPTETYQSDKIEVDIMEPNYYETFNKIPTEDNKSQIMVVLAYQFGQLNVSKSICLTRQEMLNIMQLLSQNNQDNVNTINHLTKMLEDPKLKGLAYYKRNGAQVDIETTNNIILSTQDALKKLDDPLTKYPFIDLTFSLREIFMMFYICDVTLMVGNNTDIPNPRKEITEVCYKKLACFFDPKLEYKKNG